MLLDPVCGMKADSKSAAATYEHKGAAYYFCSPGCKAAFEKNPEKYLEPHQGHSDDEHLGHH